MAYQIDLSEIWLFSSCSAKELNTIRKALEAEIVSPGKVLCAQGDPGNEFYFIVAGEASVTRNKRRIAVLGPGQYFGELALLDRGPRSATVTAQSEMELLILGHRDFTKVLDTIPTLGRRLLGVMASRLRESDAKAFP